MYGVKIGFLSGAMLEIAHAPIILWQGRRYFPGWIAWRGRYFTILVGNSWFLE